MVSRRGRAQLILIGAVMVATLVFGVSLLLNSLLFTGASGASSATAELSKADTTALEVQRGVRSLVVRLNHRRRNATAAGLGQALEENLTRYSRLLGETAAASGSVLVRVEYDNGSSATGIRIVQSRDDDFRRGVAPAAAPDWTPVPGPGAAPPTPPTAVGWFTVNVNVENTSTDPFAVVADNGSRSLRIELRRSNANVSVTTDPPSGGPTTCESVQGRVLLDLYSGRGYAADCEFAGVGTLSGPTSLSFVDGDRIEGRYAIAANRTNPRVGAGGIYPWCVDPTTGSSPPPRDANPCVSPVVWSANVTTTVSGEGLRYENSYNLTVYTD